MKRKTKIFALLTMVVLIIRLFSFPAFAVTKDEVQKQVDSVGRNTVTGNIFVWFLCAIAFL